MVQELQNISPKHRRMMMALEIEGKTPKEVCEEYNITNTGLWQVRQSQLWKKEEDIMKKELRSAFLSKLKSLIPKAILALEQAVSEENSARDRIHASKEILDRSGIIKVSEPEPTEAWIPLTFEGAGSSGLRTVFLPPAK